MQPPPYFTSRDGQIFAGSHLLIDIWKARNLDSLEVVRKALLDSVAACKATLCNLDLHQFGEAGIYGVVTLSQSHITIHSWPEYSYAAIDAFMCGDSNPHAMVPVIREAFRPEIVQISEHRRGMVADPSMLEPPVNRR